MERQIGQHVSLASQVTINLRGIMDQQPYVQSNTLKFQSICTVFKQTFASVLTFNA